MPWGYAAAAVGSYLAADRSASATERASRRQGGYQEQALDYLREVEELPLEIRNQFLPQLAAFYSGEGQNELINSVKDSPFYQQMIEAGQEGVLDRAGAMGLSRSGNTAQDLSRSNQQVLQGLVGQRLSGMSSLAQLPLNTNAIAGAMQGIGQTQAQGITGTENAMQQGYGGMLQALLQGLDKDG